MMVLNIAPVHPEPGLLRKLPASSPASVLLDGFETNSIYR
jgi:hypothetical protein